MEVIILLTAGLEDFFTADLYKFCSKFLLTRENNRQPSLNLKDKI